MKKKFLTKTIEFEKQKNKTTQREQKPFLILFT